MFAVQPPPKASGTKIDPEHQYQIKFIYAVANSLDDLKDLKFRYKTKIMMLSECNKTKYIGGFGTNINPKHQNQIKNHVCSWILTR